MPYKVDTLKLKLTETQDRRIKLLKQDHPKVRKLRQDGHSYMDIAKHFGVSKRLIIFICRPDTQVENLRRRAEAGGWRQYYVKANNTKAVRENRRYRNELFQNGEIKPQTVLGLTLKEDE